MTVTTTATDVVPAPAVPQRDVSVLYIGGVGRSGSTLLDRMLGQLPDVCAVGEIRHLWRRGVIDGQRCGCGARFHDCGFWRAVGQEAFGGWARAPVAEAAALHDALDRQRNIPALAWAHRHRALEPRVRAVGDILSTLYAAIAAVSGTRVIVDSSKHAAYSMLLRSAPGIDLRMIHLVRDSCGVANSWSRRVLRPEVVGRVAYMPHRTVAGAAVLWVTQNLELSFARRLAVPTVRVRYEDLVDRPRAELERIARWAELPHDATDLRFVGDGWLDLRATHSVAGNPSRFRHGRVPLHVDDAWRSRMSRRQRWAVVALTWPLRIGYGYPVAVRGERP